MQHIRRPHAAQQRSVTLIAMVSALLLVFSSIAAADIVYNDVLEGTETLPSIDIAAEILNVTAGATATSVTLSVTATDPADDHSSCNIEGAGPNDLVLNVVNSAPTVASVVGPDLGNPALLLFDGCDSGTWQQVLTVTGLLPGTANITFTVNPATSVATLAGQRDWTFTTAAFNVVVTSGGSDGEITYCDDPAAPAWAAHILKFNQRKNKKLTDPRVTNYVAMTAQAMGPGTLFQDIAKDDHDAYELAVRDYLITAGAATTLAMPATWPAQSCTTVTS